MTGHTGSAAPGPVPEPAVRASDADRERTAEILRSGYAEGRLMRAELDQRVAAAYGARTREQLRVLTVDLPAGTAQLAQPAVRTAGPDPCLLCLLLCMCPPAGLVYWLVTTRRARALTEGTIR